jgi:uncharacterized protein (DUF885 family)
MKILKQKFLILLFYGLVFLPFSIAFSRTEDPEIKARKFFEEFEKEYEKQQIPDFGFEYRENFRAIANLEKIASQKQFFERYQNELKQIDRQVLRHSSRYDYDQLEYELALNLERLRLEEQFRKSKNQTIPVSGLAALENGAAWYQFYIRYYTSTSLTPDQLMQFGEQEVARVQKEIRKLRAKMGFAKDSARFYQHLKSPKFYLTYGKEVEARYQQLQKTVVKNLAKLFQETEVPFVQIKPWPEAGPNTPPGYYHPAGNSAEASTFYYNFYGEKHNVRATDWMFMHEGIPGHHYQSSLRNELTNQAEFSRHFYYPANTEGWAAYVENYGQELGLYQTPAQELGKWEWDLVRSVRVVIDVGIHAKGWGKERAIAYWKNQVPGQDEIAEREVNRCLNWAGQVLSYKAGEKVIKEMLATRKAAEGKDFDLRQFHADYLAKGSRPMVVIQKAMLEHPFMP